MRKSDLIRRLAEDGNTSPEEAADQLDTVVHETLRRLRSGKAAVWPGLGSFQPDAHASIRFEPAAGPSSPPAPRRPRREKKRGKA